MAVTGYIVQATGFVYDTSTVRLLALIENKNDEGNVKVIPFRYDTPTNTCYYSASDIIEYCIIKTRWNLKDFIDVYVTGQGVFNFGCLQSFPCTTVGCISCPSYSSSYSSYLSMIPIRAKDSTAPQAPPNLAVAPQNGALNIKWDPVTNVEVFTYKIDVFAGAAWVDGGYAEASLRDVTIGNLTNGVAYTVKVKAISHSNVMGSESTKTGTPAGAPRAEIFNYCWGVGQTPPCPIPPVNPPVTQGQNLNIVMDIANRGPSGRVRGVIKVGTATIADKETTLGVYPGGGLFSVTGSYTMPGTTITIVFEAYGWDGTKWVLTHTLSQALVPSQINCTGLTLAPFSASIKAGEKVTFTATVTPATTAFDVQWKDRAGTILGTCKTSGGSCQFIWDSAGKSPGTYYVTAYVPQGGCQSLESVITLSPAIRQWNVNVYVRDSVTNNPVVGASVTIGTQSKMTDASGFVQFRVDEGDIDITISKSGYNTFTTAELVFSDKTFNYVLSPTGIAKGSIHFVSLPVGAEIFIDGADQSVKTNNTVTNIPAGEHAFTLKLAGYNDFIGKVTVVGGQVVEVYVVLTPSTPGAGALYVASTPGAADITIDGQPQSIKTPATITNLTAGSHEVKLTKTGYQDLTATVTIKAGTTTYLNVSLTVLPGIGTLEISSTPAGARVFIDSADAQKVTPATITNLSSGDHTYKLVLSGYTDATGTFTIEPGKTTTASVPLTKAEAAAGVGAGTILGISLLGLGIIGAVVVATREKKPEYTLPGYKGG